MVLLGYYFFELLFYWTVSIRYYIILLWISNSHYCNFVVILYINSYFIMLSLTTFSLFLAHAVWDKNLYLNKKGFYLFVHSIISQNFHRVLFCLVQIITIYLTFHFGSKMKSSDWCSLHPHGDIVHWTSILSLGCKQIAVFCLFLSFMSVISSKQEKKESW